MAVVVGRASPPCCRGSERVGGVALWYGALWFTLNGFQAALLAVAPDRVPERLRGAPRRCFAVAGPVGALVGVNLAALGFAGDRLFRSVRPAWRRRRRYFCRSRASRRFLPPWRRGGRRAAVSPRSQASARAISRSPSLFRVLMFSAQFAINNYLLYILARLYRRGALPGHDARGATGVLGALRTWRDAGGDPRRPSPRRAHLAPPHLCASLRGADGAGDAGPGAVAELGRHVDFRRPRRRWRWEFTRSST